MIQCLAIDDEPLALQVIKKYIAATPVLHLRETFTDAINAREFLKTHPADLIFLDIQMPDISGIQFFESLSVKPLVIFTTAYSEFAAKGFDLEAVDYLVKPIKFDRFIQAVGRAIKMLDQNIPVKSGGSDFFFVKSDYQSVRIDFDDILYIEGLDDYVKIHLRTNPKPILTLMSRKSLMKKLPMDQFMRVHRSFIVPIRLILSIHNRHISLGNIEIPVGDTYVRFVQDWLNRH
jgi:two-component system, LytTR family, response regulator